MGNSGRWFAGGTVVATGKPLSPLRVRPWWQPAELDGRPPHDSHGVVDVVADRFYSPGVAAGLLVAHDNPGRPLGPRWAEATIRAGACSGAAVIGDHSSTLTVASMPGCSVHIAVDPASCVLGELLPSIVYLCYRRAYRTGVVLTDLFGAAVIVEWDGMESLLRVAPSDEQSAVVVRAYEAFRQGRRQEMARIYGEKRGGT